MSSLGNANEAGSLGKNPLIRAGVLNWNATINYVGAGNSTDRQIRFNEATGAGDTGGFSLLNNGSGPLVFTSGTLNNYIAGQNSLGNRVFTLGGTNANSNEIQSVITNNKATGGGTGFSDTEGTIGITKTGSGRWILSGNNTYTGSNTVSSGLLIAANANALGSTYAGTTVSSGASLGLQGNITTGTEALSINGTGVGGLGALRNISGANAYAGAVTLAADSTIGADAGALTVSGAITGTNQALTVVGSGTVTLSNAANTFGSGLTGNNPGLFVKGGNLRNGVANAVSSNLMVTVESGTWDLAGYNQTVRSEWGRGLMLGNAAGSSSPTVTTGTGTLTIQGETVSGAQCRIDYLSAGNPLGGVVSGNVAYSSPADILAVVVGDSANADIDLTINAVISKVGGAGGGFFLKGDQGKLLLNGLNTFNVSSPRVDDGTLILGVNDPANGSAGALGQGTAQVTVGFNGTGNRDASLLLRDGVTSARSVRTMNNTNTGRAGDTRTLGGYDATGASTFSGRIELFNAANDGGMTRLQALGSSTVAFSGEIVDNPSDTAVGINKIGAGTVVLSGNTSYRGATTISAGTLQIGNGSTTGAVGSTSGISLASGATLAFNRSDAYGGNFSRTITGSGGVVLSSGTLTLQNTGNTFSGGVVVNGGVFRTLGNSAGSTITVNSGGSFGMAGTDTWGNAATMNTPAVTINAGGSMTTDSQFNSLRNLTLNGGTVTVNGGLNSTTGALVLGGTVTAGGAATSIINSGTGSNNFIRLGRETVVGEATVFNVSNAAGQLLIGADLTNNFGSSTAGLTKSGPGALVLSGSNSYTAATTVSAGVLEFSTINALRNSSGVSIAGGASLRYSGGVGSLDRNITVTSGTGTVSNAGGGLLTLAGTLSKNGTVLRLTGGAFDVTGQIVGTNANSDLLVDGTSTVTLSSTNSYNGPTFVNQASNLIVGINNAIPSNSIVTLGNATTTGTLSLGSNSNAIGGLAFGSGGGTLRMTASNTGPTAQLTAATGTMTLTNGTLDLGGSGTSAGYYRLLSAQSIGGSLASITGSSAAYQVVTTATSVDYQQRAVLGAVSVTNPGVSIITGGSAAFTYTVANSALSGGASLSFTGSNLSNVAGSSSGSVAAGGTSGAISGLFFNGTTVGSNQQGTFTVSAPSAYGATTATGTVAVTVLDHATSSLASGSSALLSTVLNLGTWDYSLNTWTSGTNTLDFRIYNLAGSAGAGLTADLSLLSVSSSGNGFSTNLGSYTDIQGGQSGQYWVSVNPSTFLTSGTQSWIFTLGMSDKTGMSGATATNTLTVTANVVVVPEPGALVLAGAGLAAAAWALRRRR